MTACANCDRSAVALTRGHGAAIVRHARAHDRHFHVRDRSQSSRRCDRCQRTDALTMLFVGPRRYCGPCYRATAPAKET